MMDEIQNILGRYGTMTVRVQRLHPDAQLPKYGRPGDAGLDIHALVDLAVAPGERVMVPTGIALAIPPGTVGLVWDRSGMAAKHGIKTMAGVIDHTYRGELKIVLFNTSDAPHQILKGDRIAQLLVQPVITTDVIEVTELDETVRVDGGFGSSGR